MVVLDGAGEERWKSDRRFFILLGGGSLNPLDLLFSHAEYKLLGDLVRRHSSFVRFLNDVPQNFLVPFLSTND